MGKVYRFTNICRTKYCSRHSASCDKVPQQKQLKGSFILLRVRVHHSSEIKAEGDGNRHVQDVHSEEEESNGW